MDRRVSREPARQPIPSPAETNAAYLAACPERDAPAAPAAPTRDHSTPELPSFKPGLWEYRRTVKTAQSLNPPASTVKKCADPSTEMREKKEALKKKGCPFEPVKRVANRYSSSWTCPTAGGLLKFRGVLIVKDSTGYEDLSEMRAAQHLTQQSIEATRVGDCPAGSGVPVSPSPKPPPHS
jgi:hypothetical protein